MFQISKCPRVTVVLSYFEASGEVSKLSYKSLLFDSSRQSYCSCRKVPRNSVFFLKIKRNPKKNCERKNDNNGDKISWKAGSEKLFQFICVRDRKKLSQIKTVKGTNGNREA